MKRNAFRAVWAAVAAILFLSSGPISFSQEAAQEAKSKAAYDARDYSKLLGMKGFSDTLLNNHFKLYQGYVKNAAALSEKLDAMRLEGKDRTAEYAELKRRFGWEFNGMRLHEYYFEGLGGTDNPEAAKGLYERLAKEYGSFDAWKKDFISTGMMRGIGWVVLYEEPRTGKLVNAWINEHDVGHLAGAKPILVMDVFEHAFITDYQLDRAAYIEAFFNNIDWQKTSLRLSGE